MANNPLDDLIEAIGRGEVEYPYHCKETSVGTRVEMPDGSVIAHSKILDGRTGKMKVHHTYAHVHVSTNVEPGPDLVLVDDPEHGVVAMEKE